jgi:hypothetical protein
VALNDLTTLDDEPEIEEPEPEPAPALAPAPEPEPGPDDEPVQVVADAEAPARIPKPAGVGSAKVVPITAKVAARPASGPVPLGAPAVPTPIAHRAAVNSKAGDPAPAPKKPASGAMATESAGTESPEGQEGWVGPRAIEAPVVPPKPRPWMP